MKTDKEALDAIAEIVKFDDGDTWTDAYGKLESIWMAVEETGREVLP